MSEQGDIQVGALVVRPHARVAQVHGQVIELTSREFDILLRLAAHPGWVYSCMQLADGLDEVDFSPESVSVHVSRLRHKLSLAGTPDVLQTVRGFGYRLQAEQGDGLEESEQHSPRVVRDAVWELAEVAALAERIGTRVQQQAVAHVLDGARSDIYEVLAELHTPGGAVRDEDCDDTGDGDGDEHQGADNDDDP